MAEHLTNNIRIDGHDYSLASNPLRHYLEMNNITIEGYCTVCNEGYLTDWDLIDNKLYLVDVTPCYTDEEGEMVMSMEHLFPGEERVFADWFSGELEIYKGEMLDYSQINFKSTFEEHIYIEIKEGEIVNTYVEDNRGKVFID